MSDERAPDQRPKPDSDLSVKWVVITGLGLAVATALSALVAWGVSVALRGSLEARDPQPPALLEALAPYEPPSPNLQTDPSAELATLRQEEQIELYTWGWVDPERTLARVSIDRAMELMLEEYADGAAFGGSAQQAPPDAEGVPDEE